MPEIDPVVCSLLGGRLGNQMFQYAAGLSLARRIGGVVMLDAPMGKEGQSGNLLSGSFELAAQCQSTRPSLLEKLQKGIHDLSGKQVFSIKRAGLPIYRETGFTFDSGFSSLRSSCYLIGRWQSPRYFEGVEEDIRSAFEFAGELSGRAQAIEAAIRLAVGTVAVHIRRGDYVSKQRTLARHGIALASFYDEARKQLEGLEGTGLTYYIFSDDPAAARSELAHWDRAVFIDGNTKEEDLHLMALADHNIIANSSFSWWAAWLNRNSGKRVLAPKQWFAPRMQARKSTKDLFPKEWILV